MEGYYISSLNKLDKKDVFLSTLPKTFGPFYPRKVPTESDPANSVHNNNRTTSIKVFYPWPRNKQITDLT